ncbi:MAG TPA: M20 family metallopeptidase [Phycisphaerae bacterium]|nr:M20 family metallopeptidase [Phycisphaerae bacterium]HPU25418.1 M20 family metallopeptidase [Phycisphaerae bacterium]
MIQSLSEADKKDLLDLLTRLVAIESVNRDPQTSRRTRPEERIAAFVTEHLRSMGMVVEAREMEPGRPNLIAHWPDQGAAGAPSLMLNAHLDTVPVDGMTVNPFNVTIRDGRAYGRGTCDTKGSMAAFLTALAIARREGALPSDKLYFVATVAEETCCQGAAALMASGFRTDAAIVGEATGCRVVTSHKGPLWLTIETHGRACHASMPHLGVNAIEIMSRVVQFVHGPAWQGRIKRSSHPLLGESTMSVTTIEGGAKINIIPDTCRIQIDGRLVPSEPANQVAADFRRMLAEHLAQSGLQPSAAGDINKSGLFSIVREEAYPPLDCSPDAPVARRLGEICREFNGQPGPLGVNYFADTGPFNQAGIDAVLFGPGDIAQAHTVDEYIELEQLYQAAEIILTLLTRHAGRSILRG